MKGAVREGIKEGTHAATLDRIEAYFSELPERFLRDGQEPEQLVLKLVYKTTKDEWANELANVPFRDDGSPVLSNRSKLGRRIKALTGFSLDEITRQGWEIILPETYEQYNADGTPGWFALPELSEQSDEGFTPVMAQITVGEKSVTGRNVNIVVEHDKDGNPQIDMVAPIADPEPF